MVEAESSTVYSLLGMLNLKYYKVISGKCPGEI